MTEPVKTQTVVIDGLTVETTSAGVAAINRLISDKATLVADHEKAIAAKDADLAKKDSEIATKDAEITKLKADQITDAEIDKRVAARADLVTKAKALAPALDFTGMADTAIRKAVVVAKFGDESVKDKSEAYIDARFDVMTEDADTDPARQILKDAKPVLDAKAKAEAARADHLKSLADGWKAPAQTQH